MKFAGISQLGGRTGALLSVTMLAAAATLLGTPWSRACGAERPRCPPICGAMPDRAKAAEPTLPSCIRFTVGAAVTKVVTAKVALGRRSEGGMSEAIVHNTDELVATLRTSGAGDHIFLAPGVYSPVTISNVEFSENVVIQSIQGQQQAQISQLTVSNSVGITFKNIEFAVEPNPKGGAGIQILNSRDVHLAGVEVHGTVDENPLDDPTGVLIKASNDVSVVQSKFHDLQFGIGVSANDGISISSNSFYHIRTDGVRVNATSNIDISKNYFTDYRNVEGDHRDAIQFWTTNATTSARNILIDGNVMMRGDGAAMQGVFIQDNNNTLPFLNVTITNNLMVGTNYNGVGVFGADGLQIRGNTIVGEGDQVSWIRLKDAANAVIEGNQTQRVLPGNGENVAQQDNRILSGSAADGETVLKGWLEEHAADIGSFPPGLNDLLQRLLPDRVSALHGGASDPFQVAGDVGHGLWEPGSSFPGLYF